jgi:hypothetical protein
MRAVGVAAAHVVGHRTILRAQAYRMLDVVRGALGSHVCCRIDFAMDAWRRCFGGDGRSSAAGLRASSKNSATLSEAGLLSCPMSHVHARALV